MLSLGQAIYSEENTKAETSGQAVSKSKCYGPHISPNTHMNTTTNIIHFCSKYIKTKMQTRTTNKVESSFKKEGETQRGCRSQKKTLLFKVYKNKDADKENK